MSRQVERISKALQEANPSMFGGAPRAGSLQDALELYEQVAQTLIELGVRHDQGQPAQREGRDRAIDSSAAEFEPNVVTLERVSNGYLIRHLPSARSIVVGDNDHGPVWVAADMLASLNELIGEVGSRHDPERVRVIVLPGDEWIPADPNDCEHRWVERHDPEGSWFCPCGAKFQLEHDGRSLSAMVSFQAPDEHET